MLRKESFLWFKKDVLAVSETCVILHNMLVRLNQEGIFQDEASEDGEVINLVTELYDEERSRGQEREVERTEQQQQDADGSEDWVSRLEELEIREGFMTSSAGFQALREDLTKAAEERRRR